MQSRTVERVESWSSRPFSGGHRALHELADADFSGAVSAAGSWLFMLNGRVIGVFGGDVEDFGDADGTVYEAPDEAVALLTTMQERGGETQAKYYTNDTPLSEASDTLADANFTGYIELSENVLSGDYYVVYYGGRSMSAAYVGASEQLLTGDEAFERADDEVGVYEVVKTPVNVTELPQVEDDEDAAAGGTGAAGAAGSAAAGSAATGGAAASGDDDTDSAPDADAGADTAAGPDPDDGEAGEAGAASETAAGSLGSGERSSPDREGTATGDSAGDASSGAASGAASDAGGDAASGTAAGGGGDGRETTDRAGAAGAAAGDAGPAPEGDDERFDQEREWQNANSVPTLDPDESKPAGDGGKSPSGGGSGRRRQSGSQSSRSGSSGSNAGGSRSSGQQSGSGGKRSTVERLKQAVKQREEKLEAAAERIENLEAERETLGERVEELERERDELRAKVEELEAELAASDDGGSGEGDDLSPAEALEGTNLFVRYNSKGRPTLDELDASTDREAVNENMRIDHHTQFEEDSTTVDGEPFDAFLEESAAFRFVSWAVRDLPYEIRDAGHESGLRDLYEALPKVDRAELDGVVAVETEDGERTSHTFDVVLRDRMGNSLVVADLNSSREPVTGSEMDDLVADATDVREGSDSLAAAMCVTASFFEPAALERAEEETSTGGFLSGGDRASYVKLARKTGYHLCLVEDRNDAFHLTVPEL